MRNQIIDQHPLALPLSPALSRARAAALQSALQLVLLHAAEGIALNVVRRAVGLFALVAQLAAFRERFVHVHALAVVAVLDA